MTSKPNFIHVSYIATTPQRLWDALTRGDFTKKYWSGRRIDSDWQAGSPVRFYDGDSDTLTDEGQVLESAPPYRLAYTFRPIGFDMPFSRVTFLIEPGADLVKFTLIHDELTSEEIADGFRQGWAPILSSLKTYLETGQALNMKMVSEEGEKRAG